MFNQIPVEQIKEALKIGKSLRGAAKHLNINYNTFRKSCIYNNIEYNSSTSAQQSYED